MTQLKLGSSIYIKALKQALCSADKLSSIIALLKTKNNKKNILKENGKRQKLTNQAKTKKAIIILWIMRKH